MCLSQGQWARKNCWRFLEFPPSWPGFSGANLTGLLRLVLGGGEEFVWGGVCGGCLVAKGSASPSLGFRTLPKPHTKKRRATAGLVASLGWGPSTMPGGPACGSPTRTPRVRCAPGQAGIRGSPATHPGAREAACCRGYSSPRGGGDTRWAHWAAGSLDPASRL